MNLELPSNAYNIKIDFKNKLKIKNDSDINEETSELNIISKYFEKEIPLEVLNSFIDKMLDKNTNDPFKFKKHLIKQYKKEFPFTQQDLSESVKTVLASNFYPNFCFNKKNIENVSRMLCYIYKNLKKYGINNEEKLIQKIKNISLEEKDLINMYLDFDFLKTENSKKILQKRKQYKSRFYANSNPKTFNSTGKLTTINELSQEENIENNQDGLTSKNGKTNDSINSSESDNDNISEGVKKIINKIKGIFDSSKKDKKKEKEKNNLFNLDELNDISKINNENNEPISLYKEYFIYPEKNYKLSTKLEIPIELIILLKKMENVKTLTFQIIGMNKKMVKENIILLYNINLLFPNFSEIKIDLNDDKLSGKLNKIYEGRQEELLKQNKLNYRILKYEKNYQIKTTNCWVPEGDIIYEKDSNNNKNSEKNVEKKNYILEENVYENSNYYKNKLIQIDKENNPNFKYIISPGQNKYSLSKKEFLEIDELEESEETMSKQSGLSDFTKISETGISPIKRKTINTSYYNPKFNEKIDLSPSIEITHIEQNKRKGTPQILLSFVKKKKEPFEMIFLYSWFLEKITNIKTLSLYFNDGFSLETEFYLKSEDITFEKFNFLLFLNKLKELNEVNIAFNSIDNFSFKKICGLINYNKNISILRINFFPPNVNFEESSLLKLCSLMKLSLRHLYKEQKLSFIKERDIKDLETDYYLLNHKFDFDFEKNICSLFNIIKANINKYNEIVFRFDLPFLLLSCDKYIIIIIKFIINILSIAIFSKNKINILKIISPELILDGRIMPYLLCLFQYIQKFEGINNLNEFLLKCKIFRIPNIFNFCLYNITNIKIISIGDMDFPSFNGFIDIYSNNLNKMTNLKIIKIGLNNSIISFNDKISEKINEFTNKSPKNLEQKILFSFIEMNNDLNKLEKLFNSVQNAKINQLVIQIGKNNQELLTKLYDKLKKEIELLYLIMTYEKYNKLIDVQIITHMRKFFSKHKEKIIVCKPFFSSNEFY